MKKIITLAMFIAAFTCMMGVAYAPPPATVPDAGSTSALMGMALAGLAVVRRFIR